jgi:tripartite-type tricarboxylate transporter receptor subunit TctC
MVRRVFFCEPQKVRKENMIGRIICCLALLAGTTFGGLAQAQSWPAKVVRLVVPQSPASNLDIVARALASQMQAQTGQPFIVVNRPGAGSTLGPADVARAQPDGYTLLVAAATLTIAPSTVAHLPFDTERDLTAILPLTNTPLTLVVPHGKYSSVADLIAEARAKKGALNYASVGFGSASHFMGERFGLAGDFHAVQVPFRGTNEALTEMMSGRSLDFFFAPLTTTRALILDKKIDCLAVTSSSRVPTLPDVPTMAEAGYPKAAFDMWVGIFAPAGTPSELTRTLHEEISKAVSADSVRTQFANLGNQPMPAMTATQFALLVKDEIERNAQIAKTAGIQPQ